MKTAPAAPLQESTTTPPFFSVRFDSDNTSLSVSAQKPPNQKGGANKKRRPRRRRPKDVIEATTPPATTQTWLNMQQLDSVGFYGSPSPIFSSCKNPQWVCYGDFITIKLPNYSSGDYWYGPWWTVHSMNFNAELSLTNDNGTITNPTYYSCWNSYGVFLTPYYYSGGYDHNSTSVGVFQIIPYGASASSPCAPGTSPLCTKNSWYGQPVMSGDTIYLQWNLICTNNNPNYCEVPYCWDNVGSNVARVAWYNNNMGVKNWPLYISQYYAFSDSTNTGTGNSCLIYDMQQLINVKDTGNSNPDNQVYMNNSSWSNDEQTLFVVTGTSGKNLVYGGSVTFAPYNLSGTNVVSMSIADVVAGRLNPEVGTYIPALPNQFDTQLALSTSSATEFQIMPAVNPLVTTSPTQTLYCFASPSACSGDKPNCGHGTPGCVGTTWTCPGDLVACSCAMGMCTPGGLCVTPAGQAPTKTIDSATGKCTYSCAKSSNPYLYFLIPAIIILILLFVLFIA